MVTTLETSGTGLGWYVIQTKVKSEAIAKQNLSNQGFNTFLPMIGLQRHRRGRWQCVSEALFPGYIFIELNLQEQNTAMLRSTRGVVKLVSFGATPLRFPTQLLNQLMKSQEVSGDSIDPTTVFEHGDEVEIIGGPMAGLRGVFTAKNSMERVVVLLNILGTGTRVSVSPHQVAKAV